jgi:hypothetical protein
MPRKRETYHSDDWLRQLERGQAGAAFFRWWYRDSAGSWFDPLKVEKGILFDRVRIAKLLEAADEAALAPDVLRETFPARFGQQ